jgi:RNA polymerase sigma-70 factor (ECF subfamily)
MNLIQSLPEVDRAAFLLRVQHELSYDEIARILQLPLTTLKVKIHRARLKLAAHQIGEIK